MTGGAIARRRAREVANKLLRPLGLRISRIETEDASMPNWPARLRYLKQQGFAPKTIFDVGVAAGTPELYAAFPKAFYYLVDPTRESVPHMKAIAQRVRAEILNLALGERKSEFEIEVRLDDIGASSFFEEIGPLAGTQRYSVPVRRFDEVIGAFERPALCKVDVQGAEIFVLRGMGNRISDVDAFIVETSTIATMKGAPEAEEVISFLGQHGFVIYDFLALSRRPLDMALAQLDVLFIKRDSPMRADRRWRAHLA